MPRPVLEAPSLTARGAVVGRPRREPPADAAQRIEQLTAEGRGVVGVAAELGTTREVLRRWMSADPSLQEAFDVGRERERHELHQLMLRDARDGEKPNINAMFLLKCRHGYREGDAGEQGSRVNITFNLPGALSRDDFMKTVVADGK
jgi:hypothetical protein